MINPIYIYNNDKNTKNCITAMLATEIRVLIQNWRKKLGVSIDYRIPTLCVWFKEDIIKAALIDGITDVATKEHLFETCLVDKVEFKEPPFTLDKADIIFWSPLGGEIGYGTILTGNVKSIQDAIDYAIKNECYNKYM